MWVVSFMLLALVLVMATTTQAQEKVIKFEVRQSGSAGTSGKQAHRTVVPSREADE